MSDELIDRYIDRAAIKSDTDFLLAQLAAIDKSYSEVKNSLGALTFSTNSKDVVAGLKAQAEASKQATKALVDLEKVQQAKLKTDLEAEKVAQQRLRTEKARTDQTTKTVTATKAEQKAIDDLGNDYKQLSLAYNEAALKAKNLALQQGSNTPAAKAALAEANALGDKLKEVDALTGQYTRNVGNYSSAFTGYALTLRGLRGPTKLLGEALGIGAQEADQFRLIIEHAFQGIAAFFRGKEAKAAAETADTAATAANTTANTANTAATEAGAVAQTEFAAATTTASVSMTVFRGVLLASGIGVVIGLIALAYVRIKEFHQGIEDAGKAQKILNEALDSDSYATAVKNVIDLRENIKLAKEGFLDKKEVLNQYNETLGKTTGEVKSLDEAESILVKKGPAYLQMMLLQAAANLALEEASKKAVEAEKIHQKKREEFANALVDTRIATPGTFNAQEYDAETKRIAYAQAKRKAAAIQEKKDEAKESLNIFNKFRDDAAKLSKDSGLDLLGGKFDDKKKKDIKTIADAVAELRKELAAIQGKVDLGELAPKDADIDRVKAFDKAFEDIFKRGGTTSTPIVKQLAVELSPISQRVLEQQIKDLIAKLPKPTEVLNPPTESLQKVYDTYKSFADDEAKLFDEIAQRQLTVLQTQSALEQVEITKKYAAGKIGKTEYESEILRITEKYGRLGLQEQAKWLQEEINLLPAGTKAKEDAEKKLAELQILLNKKVLTDDQIHYQERAKILEGFFQKAQEAANKGFEIVGGFLDASINSQKNAIQGLEDSQQQAFENDVARINASTATEQEKHDRIAILEAQRAAQKQKNDRDQRQLDLQRARFDKAQSIANIILATTVAVLHQLGTGDPFTAFARAFAVGAIGAAQLAVAIATPLPRFFRGKDENNKFEGVGWVDDGGKTEPILREDGTLEMSNRATPRLTYLDRNDIVFPSVEALRNRVAMSQTDRVLSNGMLLQQNNTLIDLKPIERKLDGVIDAYNSRPVEQTVWTENGVIKRVQNGFSQTEYINKYARGK